MSRTESDIQKELMKFRGDIGKCVNYFLDELGFSGVVIYKDPVDFSVPKHFHKSDDYLFILEGEFILETSEGIKTFLPGDFSIIEKGKIHAVLPGKGAKYLVASKDGDFDTIYTEHV